jgi:hypothetical protein
MSSNQENLRGALRLLAEETQGMEASSRVREALQRELRGRRRKSFWRAWWPMAAVAAACLVVGVWLGTARQQAGRVALAPPVVAETRIVEPEVTPAVVEPPQPAAVVQPAVRRATYTAPAAPRVAGETGSRIERPVSPWYFYTGLPAPAQGQVVRVMVSAQTASQYGVVAMGTSVPAQIFIGDDGLARAIRFVR